MSTIAKKIVVLKTSNRWDLLTHLGLIFAVTGFIFVSFFLVFLPWFTNHGETVTVPDLQNMTLDQAESYLSARGMSYAIKDSTYSKRHKPLTVLMQTPSPGEKIKQNRKIYLVITPRVPPKIAMPRLLEMNLDNAKVLIQNLDLEVGRVKYIPDLAQNVVLEQRFNGKEVEVGTPIPKGSKIDLVVGDGLGNSEFGMPNLVGLSLDEAEMVVKGSDLVLGSVLYDYNSDKEIGTVVRQFPDSRAGRVKKGAKIFGPEDDRPEIKVRAGQPVDIWVAGNPAPKPKKKVEPKKKKVMKDGKEVEVEVEDEEYDNINIRNMDEIKEMVKKKKGDPDKEIKEKPKRDLDDFELEEDR